MLIFVAAHSVTSRSKNIRRLARFLRCRIATTTACLTAAMVLSVGCRSTFNEAHFYRVGTGTTEQPNYYRLTISGGAWFSQAKYISGCYDERAVQIVFDEVGGGSGDATWQFLSGGEFEIAGSTVTTIGDEDDVCEPGKSKLMIFSTNAKVIADTIGAFAESQVVAESVIGLLQRDELEALALRVDEIGLERAAELAETREITALVASLPSGDAPSKEAISVATLRVLNAIARSQGRFEPITSIEDARLWFQLNHTSGVQK